MQNAFAPGEILGIIDTCNLRHSFGPIFSTVSDLCVEHERLAFLEGLRLGVTLMTELAEGKTAEK